MPTQIATSPDSTPISHEIRVPTLPEPHGRGLGSRKRNPWRKPPSSAYELRNSGDPFMCNRYEIAEFAREAHEIGIDYLGLCCGAGPHHVRSLAEALGRTPPASRYSPDMSKHAYFGTDESLRAENLEFAEEL